MSMTKLALAIAFLGLAACGDTVEQRAASGAIGGAAVGTAVGGPLAGAAVGGTVGALSR